MKISRKALFYAFVVLLVIAGIFFMVKATKPEEAPVIHHSTGSYDLSYEDVNAFVYATNEPTALFFYSSDDPDSQLVIKNMLDIVKVENNITIYPKLYYVDMADYSGDHLDDFILNNWSFHHYPAFLIMQIKDSKASVSDVLEWVADSPYSINDVRDWLAEHNIIP